MVGWKRKGAVEWLEGGRGLVNVNPSMALKVTVLAGFELRCLPE